MPSQYAMKQHRRKCTVKQANNSRHRRPRWYNRSGTSFLNSPESLLRLQKKYAEAGKEYAEIERQNKAARARKSALGPSRKEQPHDPHYNAGRIARKAESQDTIYPQERFLLAQSFRSAYFQLSPKERTHILEGHSLQANMLQLLSEKIHSGRITEEHDRSSIPLSDWHKIRQAVREMERKLH